MRTIKFRAKRVDSGEWVYGSYVEYWQHQYEGEPIAVHQIYDGEGDFYNVYPETVGQFTGLFDKNGMEIYEGDVVEIIHPCWVAQCETKFIDGAFFFCENDNPVNNSWVRADKFLKQSWDIKVVGNLHDNPESLKNE